MFTRHLVGIGFVFLIGADAAAQTKARANVRLGADFGGEKVLEFQYDDGSTPDVVSGTGLVLTAGGAVEVFRSNQHAFDLQANVGIKYRTIPPASNQDAQWIRFPVEALAFYNAPRRFRLGAGVATHLGNRLESSGAIFNDKITFKASPGFIGQAEWVFPKWSIDARYTAMTYTVESGGSGSVDASAIGAGFTYWFGRP